MNNLQLRDYQLKAHELIIENFKENKKVLLVVMAGGGKSITAGSFVAKYHKHYKFVLVVRKRALVEQLAEDALDTFGLDYGVFMANHPKYDLSKSIQVCSKDTMQSRDKLPFLGQENVVVMVDEADEFTDYQREIIRAYEKHKRFFYFGMTATAYNGLDFFDVAIQPIKPKELLERGILVPYVYIVPPIFNTKNFKVINGDFSPSECLKNLNSPHMIKESFRWWQNEGENRLTLVFCINQEHGNNVRDYINEYFGREIAVCHNSHTKKELRIEEINAFKNGKFLFLINIGLYIRGTNIIEIGTILDLAPTLKVNRHMQKITRGSRSNPIYKDCRLIDVANNCVNNGGVYMERPIDLSCEYKRNKKELEVTKMRVCDKDINSCFRAFEPQDAVNNLCPFCGAKLKKEVKPKLSKYAKDKLFMEQASEEAIEQKKMINEFKKILWKKKNLGKRYPNDIACKMAAFDMLDKYGREKILKIRKSIWLKDNDLAEWDRKQYKPLGGM